MLADHTPDHGRVGYIVTILLAAGAILAFAVGALLM